MSDDASPPRDTNPFQTPSYADADAQSAPTVPHIRTGPPWERDGATPGSFLATVAEIFSEPGAMFYDMRRYGGVGPPLLFGMIGSTLGALFTCFWQALVEVAVFGGGPGGMKNVCSVLGAMLCGVALVPPVALLSMFVGASVLHMFLLMLGGARATFETTVRVVGYCQGATALLLIVPACGQPIMSVMQFIYLCIGLHKAHECHGGTATAAVIGPTLLCCGLMGAAMFGLLLSEPNMRDLFR